MSGEKPDALERLREDVKCPGRRSPRYTIWDCSEVLEEAREKQLKARDACTSNIDRIGFMHAAAVLGAEITRLRSVVEEKS